MTLRRVGGKVREGSNTSWNWSDGGRRSGGRCKIAHGFQDTAHTLPLSVHPLKVRTPNVPTRKTRKGLTKRAAFSAQSTLPPSDTSLHQMFSPPLPPLATTLPTSCPSFKTMAKL